MANQKLIVRSVRLEEELNLRVKQAAKDRGFANPSAFIRQAVHGAIYGQDNAVEAAEQRIASSLDRATAELRKIRRVQQAAFAFADAEIKMLLTCLPEPSGELLDQAVARGKLRYDRFLRSVGAGLAGDAGGALKELTDRAQGE